jgi:hypothetical protein
VKLSERQREECHVGATMLLDLDRCIEVEAATGELAERRDARCDAHNPCAAAIFGGH